MTGSPKIDPVLMSDRGSRKGDLNGQKSLHPEQIINKLRETNALLSQGGTVGEASREVGITEQT